VTIKRYRRTIACWADIQYWMSYSSGWGCVELCEQKYKPSPNTGPDQYPPDEHCHTLDGGHNLVPDEDPCICVPQRWLTPKPYI